MAELVVGLAGLAPVVVKTAREIHDLLGRYRERNERFASIQLQVDVHLIDIEQVASFVEVEIDRPEVDAFVRRTFKSLLLHVIGLFERFQTKISAQVDSQKNLKSIQFAFTGHNALKKLDGELRDWRGRVGNAILSFMLVQGSAAIKVLLKEPSGVLHDLADIMQRALQNSVQDSKLLLEHSNRAQGDGCAVRYSRIRYHEGDRPLITEKRQHVTQAQVIRDIAAFLRAANPQYVALLKCQGFFDQTLQYEAPEGLGEPRTLREVLLHEMRDPKHSLNERLHIMKRLASTVLFVHLAGHVHKNIRADTVLLFRDPAKPELVLGEPYLVGFENTRKDGAGSQRLSVRQLEKYYYLPPDRQDETTRDFSMLDDIYTLGVVFLELALCFSFVVPQESPTAPWRPQSILLQDKRDLENTLRSTDLRDHLIRRASAMVPRQMGDTVAGLIVACLSCLHDAEAFGEVSQFTDQDGILVGSMFARQVLHVLDEVKF